MDGKNWFLGKEIEEEKKKKKKLLWKDYARLGKCNFDEGLPGQI